MNINLPEGDLLTAKEIADTFGIHPVTVHRNLKDAAVKIAPRITKYRRDDVVTHFQTLNEGQ